eukprot:m.30092 g.30092  ORF g.30092 m.30092 type:complete len:53 (+) comp9243_c0_seq1:1844-2002(+)
MNSMLVGQSLLFLLLLGRMARLYVAVAVVHGAGRTIICFLPCLTRTWQSDAS